MQKINVGIITKESHGDHPWEDCVADMGCGHQWRGEGDICGVLPPSSDFSGMSGGGVPSEGPPVGQAKGTIYVQALEVPSGDTIGGAAPLTAEIKLGHAHVHGEDDKALNYGQVKPGNIDDNVKTVCGAVSEGG